MAGKQTIIIAGASARAAAFSAIRAGLEPYCFDLFADADLALRCPVVKLDFAGYPRNLLRAIRQAPPGPWMYTGGLENHPRLVDAISRERELWGQSREKLRFFRSPSQLAKALSHQDSIGYPDIRFDAPPANTKHGWLVKPLRGAGGRGVREWHGELVQSRCAYFQRFINGGTAASVAFCGGGDWPSLIGSSFQLVGEAWLNAPRFGYCGSIGPIELEPDFQETLRLIGEELNLSGPNPIGLFGADLVFRMGVPWVIEVNPRYTASMELLEHASGQSVVGLHRQAFDGNSTPRLQSVAGVLGKAILFARESFTFPAEGPWLADLDPRRPIEAMPAYADIPHAGSVIEKGWPVLTFFASGATVEEVREKLKGTAAELNERFWPQSSVL